MILHHFIRMYFSLLFINLVLAYTAEEFIDERTEAMSPEIESIESRETKIFSEANDIENFLAKIGQIVILVEKSRKKGILTTAEAEEKYGEIVDTLEELVEVIKIPENAHTFLSIKGVEKILPLIVETGYDRLKKQVLILIKTLFSVAPSTTNLLIPVNVVDKLLDIFEHDPNLALKTYALDIMHMWLPKNPRVQARVMKVKGLEPFYDQVSKLDASVIYTLLDLFNKILEEHIRARNDSALASHSLHKKLYQQIGLIERMSTPQVCTGLLNIFEMILPFKDKDEQFTKVIIELMKNIKPFCLKIYFNKSRPLKIFTAFKRYFADNMGMFVKLGFDSTEVMMILEEYAKKLNNNARDEF